MTATELVTLVCPGLGLIVGYYCLTDVRFDWRSAAFCLALFFAASTYCYEGNNNTDIVRYIAFAEEMGRKPFIEAFTGEIHGDGGLYLFSFVSWIAGKLGYPKLLPALSTFVVYYTGFYYTGRIGEGMNANRNDIAAYMLFICLAVSFYSIANNVRNICAFSMVGLAIFRDVYEQKKGLITILLYILPIYLHPSAVVIIAARLSMFIISRGRTIGLMICAMVNVIVSFLYNITSSISSSNPIVTIIRELVKKAYWYMNDTSSENAMIIKSSGTQALRRYTTIALAAIICILAYQAAKYINYKIQTGTRGKAEFRRTLYMIDFAFSIGLLTISCLPMVSPQYWRFGSLLFLVAGPVFFEFQKLQGDARYSNDAVVFHFNDIIFKMALVLTLVVFAQWMRELWLYVNLQTLLLQPFVCSPFIMFFMRTISRVFRI